jgi:hypothetical protein
LNIEFCDVAPVKFSEIAWKLIERTKKKSNFIQQKNKSANDFKPKKNFTLKKKLCTQQQQAARESSTQQSRTQYQLFFCESCGSLSKVRNIYIHMARH